LNYEQAIAYIYSFTDYEVKPQFRYAPDVIDPTRPMCLMDLLGNPHRDYPTIHVAGTKGKGSVAAICASAMRVAGLRTGLYLSPHLQSFTERIQLDGVSIAPEELGRLVDDIRPAVAQIEGITTFEVITALAFLHYSQQKVDVAVIEVGLGGRLDATNVITPMVSVITSLSYDHTYLLGETLAEIAAEKGGIIKPEVPVVSAAQADEATRVLERLAAERNAPLTLVGRDWWYELCADGLDGQTFRAGRAGRPGETYFLPLLGAHQTHNATVALAVLEIIREGLHLPALDQEAIRQGLARVVFPGRFQILCRRPVLVVDGAHNVDAVVKLRATLQVLFPTRRCILVFGATADKDVEKMIETLMPVADEIILAAAAHPRAMPPADLGRLVEAQGFRASRSANVASALALAWERAGSDDVICVTGSLFVVGEALTAWQKNSFPEQTGAE
jgi:dihydrofolate synthase/folylpolyglutamate synthase